MLSFETNIQILPHFINTHFVEIDRKKMADLELKVGSRLICTLNNKVTFQCGLVALGEGSTYITVNKARLNKLNLKAGDSVNITIEKDNTEHGMKICPELETLLKQDEEGNRRFLLLPLSKQRYIIHYVGLVKNSDKRIERALMLIGNLKQLKEGNESFREMLGKEKR